jgi:hypothetical protein
MAAVVKGWPGSRLLAATAVASRRRVSSSTTIFFPLQRNQATAYRQIVVGKTGYSRMGVSK